MFLSRLVWITLPLFVVAIQHNDDYVHDPCAASPGPCKNGGVCQPSLCAEGYVCECEARFSGYNCETVLPNACDDFECQNGGTCRDYNGEALCVCTSEYFGDHCEERLDHCPKNFTAIKDEHEFCYHFGTNHVNWEHARDSCVALHDKSTLAVLQYESTNTALKNYLITSQNHPDCDGFFTALQLIDDTNCNNRWSWKHHYRREAHAYIPAEFTDWAEGQPNCGEFNNEYQACGTLHRPFHMEWNDEYCGAGRCYVCQVRRDQP